LRLSTTKPEPTDEPNPGPSPAPSPILKRAPDKEGNHIKEEDEATSSASSMTASTVIAATAIVPSGVGTQATADSGKIVQAIDQISIKTPNPKCRLHWCLIRVYRLEIQ
jgi:hypothetical protein